MPMYDNHKQVKDWIHDQRESRKRKFEFENLDLVDQEYKKKKANGGFTSAE